MYLVKLNAINSTSTHLRQLARNKETKNWTVVIAEFQSHGRGLMETNWVSEKGKNLLCSILIKLKGLNVQDNFYLNSAISIGIYKALYGYNLDNLCVKWPNDIMSGSAKLGGILIENSLKSNSIYQTIVGLGLNINQESFSKNLPNPISMKKITGKHYSRQDVLGNITRCLKVEIERLNNEKFEELHIEYESLLYKKGKIQWFQDKDGERFEGIIIGVSSQGLLKVRKQGGDVSRFDHKQIKFL